MEAFKKKRLADRGQVRKADGSIGVGDSVVIQGQDSVGEVMNLKGKQAQVRFGNIISFIDLKKLEKTNRSHAVSSKPSKRTGGFDIVNKMAHFNGELDIRGVRAEEALGKVDDYIDQAIMLGTDQVRILHGKGHGILRDLVRNHLRGHQSVASTVDEHVDFGGSGITIVTFK